MFLTLTRADVVGADGVESWAIPRGNGTAAVCEHMGHMSDLERKRLLYRKSPEYRAKAIARAKANHATNSADPSYVRLVALRKEVHQVREWRESLIERAERLDRRLIDLTQELLEVESRWKKTRQFLAIVAIVLPVVAEAPIVPSGHSVVAGGGSIVSARTSTSNRFKRRVKLLFERRHLRGARLTYRQS